jgi:hypothetical protein
VRAQSAPTLPAQEPASLQRASSTNRRANRALQQFLLNAHWFFDQGDADDGIAMLNALDEATQRAADHYHMMRTLQAAMNFVPH